MGALRRFYVAVRPLVPALAANSIVIESSAYIRPHCGRAAAIEMFYPSVSGFKNGRFANQTVTRRACGEEQPVRMHRVFAV